MIEEWFVIPAVEERKLREWLNGHPGYKFQQMGSDKDLFTNSIRTMRNAKIGDVRCKFQFGHDDQLGNLLVTFKFKERTLDEGLLGLMQQEFTVLESSCY
ncbi:hypothetical protein RA970_001713 [Cronobacter dublinensis]|nr:hypothetical protein [Cronobacter dublinensis]